jgi:hypothetical protein
MYPRTTFSEVLIRILRSLAIAVVILAVPSFFLFTMLLIKEHHWPPIPVMIFWIAAACYPLTKY